MTADGMALPLPPTVTVRVAVDHDDMRDAYDAANTHWATPVPGRPVRYGAASVMALVVHAPGAVVVFGLAFLLARVIVDWAPSLRPGFPFVFIVLSFLPLSAYPKAVNWVQARARRDALDALVHATRPELDGGSAETVVAISSQGIIAEAAGQRLERQRTAARFALETPRGFVVGSGDAVVPIPTRTLDPATVASLRTALSAWGLGAGPGAAAPAKSGGWWREAKMQGICAAVSLCTILLFQGAPSPSAPAPAASTLPHGDVDEVRLAIAGQSLAVAGEVLAIRDGRYRVRTSDGLVRDSLDGTVRGAKARGWFYAERQAQGYTATTPGRIWRNTAWTGPEKAGPVPEDAAVSSLTDDAVVIEWARASGDGSLDSCAVLVSYRDPRPDTAIRSYRRFTRQEFCSATLTPAALVEWMQASAEAVDRTFTALARR